MMKEGVGGRERLEAGSACRGRSPRRTARRSDGRRGGAELVVKAPISRTVIDLKTSIGAAVAPAEIHIDVGDSMPCGSSRTSASTTSHQGGATAEVLLNISASPLSARVVSISGRQSVVAHGRCAWRSQLHQGLRREYSVGPAS
jgi:hypothetical protein